MYLCFREEQLESWFELKILWKIIESDLFGSDELTDIRIDTVWDDKVLACLFLKKHCTKTESLLLLCCHIS
jgi:hypothetical protein